MKVSRIFLDANIFVAAVGRPAGGSGTLLTLCARGFLTTIASRRVIAEAERNIREKLGTEALQKFYEILVEVHPRIVPDPPPRFVRRFARVINKKDAPVLAAAVYNRADALVTLDTDFSPPTVHRAAGAVQILDPGSVLRLLRRSEES